MTVVPKPEEMIQVEELVALIARQAKTEGPTYPDWPGLTFYRFEQRMTPHWDEVGSVSLGMVAQGRKRVRIGKVDYFYDPLHYLVMKRGLRFQAEILEASPERPFFSFVLQVQPDLVTEVYDSMNRLVPDLVRSEPMSLIPDAHVTALDRPLTVRDLANAVNMSESAFAHVFKATTGTPPQQFLKQLRMEQANRFLLSGANVSEAADKVGYASLSHFICEFKRYFGEPPKTYARRLQNLQAAAARDARNSA